MPVDNYLFLTKKRLTEWGLWCNHIITMGLGYTNQSLISRMAENSLIISTTAKQLAPHNPEAEEINELIEYLAATLGEGRPELAKVIRIHYTELKKNRLLKISTSGLSKREYYNYLEEAQIWLSKQLCIN